MKLNTLKDLAGKLLKKGKHKLIVDNEKLEVHKKKVADSITREDVRQLINDGVIKKQKNTGQSTGRSKILLEKKKLKRKRGPGKRKGSKVARKKTNEHNLKVRGLRKRLKEIKKEDKLNGKNYKKLYLMITGNYFRGRKHLEEYINGENK